MAPLGKNNYSNDNGRLFRILQSERTTIQTHRTQRILNHVTTI
jgi:hypothetical protein